VALSSLREIRMVDNLIVTKEAPSDVIERDITSTRNEISRTLDAIREKFSINHLKEEAKDKIISSVRTMSLAAQEAVMSAKNRGQQIIRDNPGAVRMAALGVGALLMLIVLKRRKKPKMPGVSILPRMKEAEQKTIWQVRQSRVSERSEEEFKKAA
jgi:hypothetical protein